MSWKIKRQDRQTQRMFDNVTKSLLDQGNGLKRDPKTGVLYEEFLKDEHPGLDLALMYAQPGSIVAKAFAPSMAKGLVEGIRNGDTEQAMLSMLVPEGNVAKILTKVTPKAGTTRLYRITGTSGKFTPSPDGTAEFAGQWFSNMPSKGLGYGSETVRKARLAKVDNPVELQVVDIPNSQLEHYRASNILKGRSDIEYEPKEDFLIPLSMPRQRVKINNLTGNRLKDASVKLPEIPELTEAERLGIPKGERSNPKVLEDSQYWGYQQWNDRYNSAVEAGNWDEAQRLRDLHFKHKSNATPEVVYRGESEDVTNFILGSGTKRPGISFTSESPAVAVSYADITSPYGKIEVLPQQIDARQKWIEMARKQGILTSEQEMLALQDIENKKVALTAALQEANSFSHPQLRKLYIYPKNSKTIDAMGANWKYVTDTQSGLKGVPTDMHAFNAKNNGFDALRIKNVFDIGKGGYNIKSNDVVILDSKIAKLADPITKTNTGEIIPIVKRDNFHNPDIRYKQGGIVNPQQ